MARSRYLRPDFFLDEELCELPYQHRLCYQGLWCHADKRGRLEDRPRRLKAQIFPFDDVDMEAVLTDLARAGFVIRYLAEGRAYMAIKPKAWEEHQKPRSEELESRIPPPDAGAVVYASLGVNEALGSALRQQPASPEQDTGVVTSTSLQSDLAVTPAPALTLTQTSTGNSKGNSESAESLPRSTPPRDDSPVLLTFPTDGPVSEWHFTEAERAKYRGWFPNLDIDGEARAALAWISTNPTKRKTATGMPKFLTNWMTRATESGRRRVAAPGGRSAGVGTTGGPSADKRRLYDANVIRAGG